MLKSDGMKLVCTWLASECPIGHPIEITCVVYDENKQHFSRSKIFVPGRISGRMGHIRGNPAG